MSGEKSKLVGRDGQRRSQLFDGPQEGEIGQLFPLYPLKAQASDRTVRTCTVAHSHATLKKGCLRRGRIVIFLKRSATCRVAAAPIEAWPLSTGWPPRLSRYSTTQRNISIQRCYYHHHLYRCCGHRLPTSCKVFQTRRTSHSESSSPRLCESLMTSHRRRHQLTKVHRRRQQISQRPKLLR